MGCDLTVLPVEQGKNIFLLPGDRLLQKGNLGKAESFLLIGFLNLTNKISHSSYLMVGVGREGKGRERLREEDGFSIFLNLKGSQSYFTGKSKNIWRERESPHFNN